MVPSWFVRSSVLLLLQAIGFFILEQCILLPGRYIVHVLEMRFLRGARERLDGALEGRYVGLWNEGPEGQRNNALG